MTKFTDPNARDPKREFEAANPVEATRFRAMGFKEVKAKKPENKQAAKPENKSA